MVRLERSLIEVNISSAEKKMKIDCGNREYNPGEVGTIVRFAYDAVL